MFDLHQLIKLQEIDSALLELERLKGDLPKRVDELKTIMDTVTASIKNNQNRLTEIEIEIRHLTGSETDHRTKMEKLRDQLYLVKTNREYDALTSEIDHFKSKIDEEELQELELSEEKDRLEEQVKLDKLQSEQMVSDLQIQEEKLAKTVSSTEIEYKQLMSERESLTPGIDLRYIALYDRVRNARDGLAVVPVTNQGCGGCFSKLTSQTVVEIRNGKTFVQCTVCRRILFWKE